MLKRQEFGREEEQDRGISLEMQNFIETLLPVYCGDHNPNLLDSLRQGLSYALQLSGQEDWLERSEEMVKFSTVEESLRFVCSLDPALDVRLMTRIFDVFSVVTNSDIRLCEQEIGSSRECPSPDALYCALLGYTYGGADIDESVSADTAIQEPFSWSADIVLANGMRLESSSRRSLHDVVFEQRRAREAVEKVFRASAELQERLAIIREDLSGAFDKEAQEIVARISGADRKRFEGDFAGFIQVRDDLKHLLGVVAEDAESFSEALVSADTLPNTLRKGVRLEQNSQLFRVQQGRFLEKKRGLSDLCQDLHHDPDEVRELLEAAVTSTWYQGRFSDVVQQYYDYFTQPESLIMFQHLISSVEFSEERKRQVTSIAELYRVLDDKKDSYQHIAREVVGRAYRLELDLAARAAVEVLGRAGRDNSRTFLERIERVVGVFETEEGAQAEQGFDASMLTAAARLRALVADLGDRRVAISLELETLQQQERSWWRRIVSSREAVTLRGEQRGVLLQEDASLQELEGKLGELRDIIASARAHIKAKD